MRRVFTRFFKSRPEFTIVKNEYFLILLILTFRLADGLTSYLPAMGLIHGVGEANPVALLALEKWGYLWGFGIMLLVSMGFALCFVVATHLEEIRLAHRTDIDGIRKVKKFRIAGLIALVVLSSLPLINNMAIALSL